MSVKSLWEKLKTEIKNLIFPNFGKCPSCSRVLLYEEFICSKCEEKLTKPKYFCVKCGRAVTGNGICIMCSDKVASYDMCISAFTYAYPIDIIIHEFKYRAYPQLSEYLGRCIADKIKEDCDTAEFDYICYVPSSEERLIERGYNQAKLLANTVCEIIHAPVIDALLAEDSAHQVGLGAKDRIERTNRFSLKEGFDDIIKGKRIILIDDVITTGSTVNSCAGVLKMYGADYVMVASVAQTVCEI